MPYNCNIDNSSPYSDSSISYVLESDIMSGYPDGSFRPDNTVTKAEMYKIIALFLAEVNIFREDPPNRHWASRYIQYGISQKYITGSKTQLELDEIATVNEFLTILNSLKTSRKRLHIPALDVSLTCPLTRGFLATQLFTVANTTYHSLADDLSEYAADGKWSKWWDLFYQYLFCAPFLQSGLWWPIRLVLKHNNQGERGVCFEYMMQIMSCLSRFFAIDEAKHVFHYTNMTALEKMTRPSGNPKPSIKFRLSNICYLNDPMEGRLLLEKIQNRYTDLFPNWNLLKPDSSEIVVRNAFISSFILQDDGEEKLPMWIQYGDYGRGCMIEIEPSIQSMHRVVYEESRIEEYLNDIKNILTEYQRWRDLQLHGFDLNQDCVFKYASSSLMEASYLYKDDHYAHENEVRMIATLPYEFAQAEEYVRHKEIFPRLYCDSDELRIKSITFGPNAADMEKAVLSLAHRGYLSNIIMKKSKLHFR